MRGPSIQKTAAVSALLHLTILILSVVLINYTKNAVMPSPYTVSLVSPGNEGHSATSVSKSENIKSPVTETEKPAKDDKKMIDTRKNDVTKKEDQKNLDDTIAAIAAKKKVERIVKLRSVISVKAGGVNSVDKPLKGEGLTGGSKGTLFDSYYTKITEEIRHQWVYPDMGKKQLEAVVSVLIRRSGTITVEGIEKSSGDLLFDRSALKAVTKASPVSPPPYEMKIGIRFYP